MSKYKSIVNCLTCDSTFEAYNCHIKRGRGRFCSKSCNTKYNYKTINAFALLAKDEMKKSGIKIGRRNKTSFEKECIFCKSKFTTFKSKANKKFCSMSCRDKVKKPYIKRTKPATNKGPNHYNWKGGINLRGNFMRSREYKNFRTFVLNRDDNTCVICGIKKTEYNKVILHVDHIKSYSLHPELRICVNNGRTLCIDCHKKTDSWGVNVRKNLIIK